MSEEADDEPAVVAVRNASSAVRELRNRADPGHIPMRKYLSGLALRLNTMATELQQRIDKESGG